MLILIMTLCVGYQNKAYIKLPAFLDITVHAYVIVFPPASIVTRLGFLSLILRLTFSKASFLTSSKACSCIPFLIASLSVLQKESKKDKKWL